METDYQRSAPRGPMHSMVPLKDTHGFGAAWLYRCDDCDWQVIAPEDPCECPECGGESNRAPRALAHKMMGIIALT